MNNNKEKALIYIYKNKKGSKKDFINEFGVDILNSFINLGLIKICIIENNGYSWKITEYGYDFILTIVPGLKHKSWMEKFQDYIEYILYYKWEKISYLKNQKIKKEYFKNDKK